MSMTKPALQIKPLATLHPPSSSRAWLSTPHPNVPILATACEDRSVRIYSLRNFQLLESIDGAHKRSVRSIAWKPDINSDGSREKGNKGKAKRRKGRKRREDWVFATGSFDATCGIWRRKERWDFISSDADSDAGNGEQGQDTGRMSIDGEDIDDGNEEDDLSRDNEDEDEDEDDGEWRYAVALEGHESEIKSVAWSPTGQFLATCARDKSVWVWEEVIDSFNGGGGIGSPFTLNADSNDNFETVAVLSEHEGDVKSIAWHPSPNFNLLASASYDDTIRLYRDDIDDDWSCVAVLNGHEDTVWFVDFEGLDLTNPSWPRSEGNDDHMGGEDATNMQAKRRQKKFAAGPRLASGSADGTIRIWAKVPPLLHSEEQTPHSASQSSPPRVPSIIRSAAATAALDEEWVEQHLLPRRHDEGAAVYTAAWSKQSGRIVSIGSDGRVVVYQEFWKTKREIGNTSVAEDGNVINGTDSTITNVPLDLEEGKETEWTVVAEMEASHGVYEINHVCWSPRWDSGRKKSAFSKNEGIESEENKIKDSEKEEVIITTGDDGEVKVWTIE